MNNLIGQVVGQYTILDEIGRGGMATVYRATQESIGREVAVKFLMKSLLEQDPAIRERFHREAQVVASLQHPHILPVYDFGEHDGQPYRVMGFLAGGTLASAVNASGVMAAPDAMRILTELAGALDYAHSRSVIHRDFKPANVLLDEQGHAYLTDFGLAKMITGSGQHSLSVGLVGTPDYMAPDWVGESEITASVDVYSFAVSAYQLLAGGVPFRAATPMGVLMAHASSPVPDIRSMRPDLPGAVSRVFERGMAKTPQERYASAGEMVGDLEVALQAGHSTTPVPTPSLQATGPFYYPNSYGRLIFEAAEKIMGQDALATVLIQSDLMDLLDNRPPDNLKKEFSFENVTAILKAIEDVYGRRGAQAIGKLAGQRIFELNAQRQKALMRIVETLTWGLPLNTKVKGGLEFLARVFNTVSDQIVEVDEDERYWIYRVIRCPLCWGRQADEPVCWMAVGSLDQGVRSATGKSFRIIEAECIARGDAACTFLIDKTPLD